MSASKLNDVNSLEITRLKQKLPKTGPLKKQEPLKKQDPKNRTSLKTKDLKKETLFLI
jgi:hypothetical protein